MRHPTFRLATLAVLVTGVAAALPAQVAEWNGCPVGAAAVARTTTPNRRDIESLSGCVVSGAPALAALWNRRLTLSPEQRRALRSSSITLRDRRLYAAVRQVAGDAGRPTADRVTALQVLASYFEPDREPLVEDLVGSGYVGSIPRAVDGSRRDGAMPLPPGRMSEIPAQLAELAWSDPNPDIRGAALRLRQDIALGHPDITPLKPGVFTLTARCGRSVVLGSKADVVVPVELHFGNSRQYSYALKAAPNGPPSEILLALPPGPIVATVGGREVARLTDRNAPCKPGEPRS